MPSFPSSTSSQLDDDVLSVIFHFNTLYDTINPHRPCATLRATSQVCRQWRSLALSTPILWAAVLDFLGSEKWICEVVSRSGAIPLTIIIPSLRPRVVGERPNFNKSYQASKDPYIADESSFAHLSLAASLVSRSRRLDATIYTHEQWDSFRTQLPDSLPDLRTFSIKYDHSEPRGARRLTELLTHSAPQLHSLSVYGRPMDVTAARLAKLTHLEFGNLPASATPISRVLRALRAMPLLRHLKMEHIDGRKVPVKALENSGDNVTLEHLEFLGLKCPIEWCAALLPKLQIPSSCFKSIGLQASHDVDSRTGIKPSLKVLRSFLDNPALSIVEIWMTQSELFLTCSRSHSRLPDEETWNVSWHWGDIHGVRITWLFYILRETIDHALELHLTVNNNNRDTSGHSEALAHIFQLAVQTEVLTIYAHERSTPFYVMTNLAEQDTLPSLKEICLDSYDFKYDFKFDTDDFRTASLCGAMKERRRQDLPIKKIQMRDCGWRVKEVEESLKSEMGLEVEKFHSRSELEETGRSVYQSRYSVPPF